jgi:hypothetical protein
MVHMYAYILRVGPVVSAQCAGLWRSGFESEPSIAHRPIHNILEQCVNSQMSRPTKPFISSGVVELVGHRDIE